MLSIKRKTIDGSEKNELCKYKNELRFFVLFSVELLVDGWGISLFRTSLFKNHQK